ncbi:MAG: coproporphyrinogen dehydrogenase HemZ [Lachnospiraceae bacterium]|nr:coproporphyrinogen dehydrogenase HemZ [Candidatus Equihabitans merdae]
MRRAVVCSREDFFYDIHSLVKSFYPSDDVVIFSLDDEEKASEEYDAKLTVEIPPYTDRAEAKNQLKQDLYRRLSQTTGKELPWGTLSGIRPTKIPMKGLNDGLAPEQILRDMKDRYLVSDRKASLALRIANLEKSLVDKLTPGWDLYAGIPFCPTICSYCTFSSSPIGKWSKKVDQYLDDLEKELRAVAKWMKTQPNTIYIGGGTPTSLEPYQLERLLSVIDELFDSKHVLEFTVEAGRPDTVTPEKLRVLKSHPVTRISINPQTMNDRTLELIGRRHTSEETIAAFKMARDEGFDNINMDLIMGLPDEGKDEVRYTLDQVEKLDPDSLTVHSLAFKRASRLTTQWADYKMLSYENSDEVMDMASESALKMGMAPYYLYRQKNMRGNLENVGYARPGKEGLYNILIMEEIDSILACGAGASTKAVHPNGLIERVVNPKDIVTYHDRIDELCDKKVSGDLWNK